MVDVLILGVLLAAGVWVVNERRRTRVTSQGFTWPQWLVLRRRSSADVDAVDLPGGAFGDVPTGAGTEGPAAVANITGAPVWAAVAYAPQPDLGYPVEPPPLVYAPAVISPPAAIAAAPTRTATARALATQIVRSVPRPDLRALQVPGLSRLRALPISGLRPGVAGLALALAIVFVLAGQQSLSGATPSPTAVQMYVVGLVVFAGLDILARRVAPGKGAPSVLVPPGSGAPPILVPSPPRGGGLGRGGVPAPWDQSETIAPARELDDIDSPPVAAPSLLARAPRLPRLLLIGAIVLGLVGWILMRGRAANADYGAVVLIWALSLAGALAAAKLAGSPQVGQTSAQRGSVGPWVALGIVTVVAFLFRAIGLEQFPYAFGGDEGSYAMGSISVLTGELKNPFATGWYSVPTLFFFLQAATIMLFGDSVTGARMIAVLIGVSAVVFTFLLTRRLFGTAAALVAGLLLSAFHYHVHFSRLSSNQIADSLAIVAVLYFIDRTLVERKPLDAVLAGITIGMSQYFSFAGRIIPLIAATYIALFLLRGRFPVAWDAARHVTPFRLTLIGWVLLGGLLSYAPHWAYFLDHPGELNSRVNQVSMFASGWLDREIQLTGKTAPELIVSQIWRAILLPFHTNPGGWYINHRPFTGLPMAVALALGLAVTTLGFWRRPFLGLAIAYWACTVGLGLTEDPTQTQRFVVVSSLIAIFGAIAVTTGARIARDLARMPRAVVGALTAGVVLLLVGWNTMHYFGPREGRLYGDGNTLAATEMAYYARSLPAGATVYFLGPPRMFYYGFQTLPFIARNAKGVDVERPYTPGSPRPQITGPTYFAALPERAAELRFVQDWFPNGQIKELKQGEQLVLSVYEVPGR